MLAAYKLHLTFAVSGDALTDRSALGVDEKLAMLKPRNCTPRRPGTSSGGTPTAGRLAALRSMGASFSRLPSCGMHKLSVRLSNQSGSAPAQLEEDMVCHTSMVMLTVSVSKVLSMALAGQMGLPVDGVALGAADGAREGVSPPMFGTGTLVGMAEGVPGVPVGVFPDVGAVGPADGVDGAVVGAEGPSDGVDGVEVGAVGPAEGVDGAVVGVAPDVGGLGPLRGWRAAARLAGRQWWALGRVVPALGMGRRLWAVPCPS